MFSTKFEVVFESGVDFVQAFIFALESRHFFSTFVDLVDSDSEDIFGLTDVLGEVVVFHDLVLSGSLVMERFAFVFVSKGGNGGDVVLKCDDVVIGVIDFIVQSCQVFDSCIDVGVELIVLVFIADDFLSEKGFFGFELVHVLCEVLNFAFDGFVVDFCVFEVGDEGFVVTTDTGGDFFEFEFFIEEGFVVGEETGEVVFESFDVDESLVKLVSEGVLIGFEVIEFEMSVSDFGSEGIDLMFEIGDVPECELMPFLEIGIIDGLFLGQVAILVIEIMILLLEDDKLILVFPEEIDLFFEM